MQTQNEPLLTEDSRRYGLFPIKYPRIWQLYKKQEASFWRAEELDLSKDKLEWDTKLNDNERFFLKRVLAFFAQSATMIATIRIADQQNTQAIIQELRLGICQTSSMPFGISGEGVALDE